MSLSHFLSLSWRIFAFLELCIITGFAPAVLPAGAMTFTYNRECPRDRFPRHWYRSDYFQRICKDLIQEFQNQALCLPLLSASLFIEILVCSVIEHKHSSGHFLLRSGRGDGSGVHTLHSPAQNIGCYSIAIAGCIVFHCNGRFPGRYYLFLTFPCMWSYLFNMQKECWTMVCLGNLYSINSLFDLGNRDYLECCLSDSLLDTIHELFAFSYVMSIVYLPCSVSCYNGKKILKKQV